MFSKITSLHRTFQDLSHGILYFSVAQKFVDFLIFTCLRIFWNYLDLRNHEIWNLWKNRGKIGKNFKRNIHVIYHWKALDLEITDGEFQFDRT